MKSGKTLVCASFSLAAKFCRGRASERQPHVTVVSCCFSLEAYSRLTILSAAVREECDRSSNRSQQARGDDLGNGNFVWDRARLTTRLSSKQTKLSGVVDSRCFLRLFWKSRCAH